MDTVIQSDEQPLEAGKEGEVQAVPLFQRRKGPGSREQPWATRSRSTEQVGEPGDPYSRPVGAPPCML